MDYFGRKTGRLGPHDSLAAGAVMLVLILVAVLLSIVQ